MPTASIRVPGRPPASATTHGVYDACTCGRLPTMAADYVYDAPSQRSPTAVTLTNYDYGAPALHVTTPAPNAFHFATGGQTCVNPPAQTPVLIAANPINRTDATGLDAVPAAHAVTGGQVIDKSLHALNDAIDRFWSSLSINEKRGIAQGFVNPEGWDIIELADHSAAQPSGPVNEWAQDTVTIGGMVQHAQNVNYWLWGKLAKLALMPDTAMLGFVVAHRAARTTVGDDDPQFPGLTSAVWRGAWAQAGYDGRFSIAQTDTPGATPGSKEYSGTLTAVIRYRKLWTHCAAILGGPIGPSVESILAYRNILGVTYVTIQVDGAGASSVRWGTTATGGSH